MSSHSVEAIKRTSARLRGSLRESLSDAVTGGLREDDRVLLKFHGSYQQDDRDLRDERRLQKLEPAYAFMIRTRTPGGVLTPTQWLALDAIAHTFAERGLRITTRQTIQFHGVPKHALAAVMRALDAVGLDSIAACGDVNRNVVAAAHPAPSRVQAQVQTQASTLAAQLLPKTRAWHETWLDAPARSDSGEEDEPLYGEAYLPRKFKIGFAIPPCNDVDVLAQDLGFVAVLDGDGVLAGYDVCAGGGMGATHGDAQTYPRLGEVFAFVTPAQVHPLAVAAITAQRDFGDRSARKHARLKYTIDDRGLAWFKAEVERRAGFTLAPPRGFVFDHNGDRFGWIQNQDDGRWQLTLRIVAGRIRDQPDALSQAVHGEPVEPSVRGEPVEDSVRGEPVEDSVRGEPVEPHPSRPHQPVRGEPVSDSVRGEPVEPRSSTAAPQAGLRAIAEFLRDTKRDGSPHFRLTANQNLAIAGIADGDRAAIDALLARHGLDGYRRSSRIGLAALACVALPTCGLAMAEAERYLPDFVARIEALLTRHGLRDAPLHLRISGCPNGCPRPYLGEIALIGKAPGRYNLMLGADHRGQRLNVLHRENLDEAQIIATLEPLFARWAVERIHDERFGDFLVRVGIVTPPASLRPSIALAVLA